MKEGIWYSIMRQGSLSDTTNLSLFYSRCFRIEIESVYLLFSVPDTSLLEIKKVNSARVKAKGRVEDKQPDGRKMRLLEFQYRHDDGERHFPKQSSGKCCDDCCFRK